MHRCFAVCVPTSAKRAHVNVKCTTWSIARNVLRNAPRVPKSAGECKKSTFKSKLIVEPIPLIRYEGVPAHDYAHSVRRHFMGLTAAALIACDATVSQAMNKAIKPAAMKYHASRVTWYSNRCNH